MTSARRLYASSLPEKVEIRNKKHQLRNDLLDFLAEKELVFPTGQVSTAGEAFVSCLVNILQYSDGHHRVFDSRSHRIPILLDF